MQRGVEGGGVSSSIVCPPVIHRHKGCVCCIGWHHGLHWHWYPHIVVIHPLMLRRISVERNEHRTIRTHHRLLINKKLRR